MSAVQQMLRADQSLSLLGINVVNEGSGSEVATMLVTEEMTNGHQICHGGLVFSLADTVFAIAANAVNAGTVTSESSISYLAPARVGDLLVADANVTYETDRRVIVDVTVRTGETTVALYRGFGRTIKPRSA
ncbi:MAG TPA: hotdog fold thioesterase [Candidatus Yaniella excrementigallinarum]|nr:hotdog fold thioesterase [Candidatus Yaniella excrementigallinarum]